MTRDVDSPYAFRRSQICLPFVRETVSMEAGDGWSHRQMRVRREGRRSAGAAGSCSSARSSSRSTGADSDPLSFVRRIAGLWRGAVRRLRV